MKDEALSAAGDKMIEIPIPRPSDDQRAKIAARVAAVSVMTNTLHDAVSGVLDVLRMEFDIESPGNSLSDFAALDSDSFVREVRKRRRNESTLSPAGLRALRDLHAGDAPPIHEARVAILDHERYIANVVHAAYGLTPDDLALIRATAPPRMPPGW